MIPSNDKSINDIQYSSFSPPKAEKSESTMAVFANVDAIPPQKSRNVLNRPQQLSKRLQTMFVDHIWALIWEQVHFGMQNEASCVNFRRRSKCIEKISSNSFPCIFASSCGNVGGKASEALSPLSRSAWIARIPSTTFRTRWAASENSVWVSGSS